MPTLVKNYQKKVTVEKLKTAYSILLQASKNSALDNGDIEYWDFETGDADAFFEKYYSKYLKVIRKTNNAPIHYNLNGSQMYDDFYYNHTHYYINNGYEITFRYAEKYKTYMIYIDVNGQKGPNILGRDTFKFQTAKGGRMIAPNAEGNRDVNLGTTNDECCNKNKNGGFCAAVIMQDGWKISNDYPW